jgi:hypothetical protein
MQLNDISKKLQARIAPGPVSVTTTDDDIQARAQLNAHNMGVPVQMLEHLFKLERRIAVLESTNVATKSA